MKDQQMERYSPIPPSPDFPAYLGYSTGFQPEISELSERRHIYDVQISMERGMKEKDQELMEGVEMESFITDDLLHLQRLLYFLRTQANVEIKDHQILLYLIVGELYVNCGVFPFLSAQEVPLADFLDGRLIRLKLVSSSHSLIHFEMLKDPSNLLMNGLPTLLQTPPSKDGRATIKEQKPICVKNFQKIGYIVKKVISLKTNPNCIDSQFINDRHLTKKVYKITTTTQDQVSDTSSTSTNTARRT